MRRTRVAFQVAYLIVPQSSAQSTPIRFRVKLLTVAGLFNRTVPSRNFNRKILQKHFFSAEPSSNPRPSYIAASSPRQQYESCQ